MRRFAIPALLPALAGCLFGGGGEASRVEEVPAEYARARLVVPPAPDRHRMGDLSALRPGQWATYREGAASRTIAVAAREGEALWIEVVEEGDPRRVSARLVGPDGTVRRAFYGEIGRDGSASPAEPQPLGQGEAGLPGLPDPDGPAGREEATVDGRSLSAVRVESRAEDLEGRIARIVALWHPDVPPVYAGSRHGGLVRLLSGGRRIELAAFGTDARPLLEVSGR